MKFDKLQDTIPYALGGKQKILTMEPYAGITLALPGRHSEETTPRGGDFVVMVDDRSLEWDKHPFTHTDIFIDLQAKAEGSQESANLLMADYLKIVTVGTDPNRIVGKYASKELAGLTPKTFLFAVQCLAVAEHRRYAKYESKFGGRYLPFRFGAGIVEGLWTAQDAAERQKRGRPGVEWLEKDFGVPSLTKDLMG